jgi:hypothetical protein
MRSFEESLELETLPKRTSMHKQLKFVVFRPMLVGTVIFAVFFSTVMLTKLITYLISSSSLFNLNLHDIAFALIGFSIGFLVDFSIKLKRLLHK